MKPIKPWKLWLLWAAVIVFGIGFVKIMSTPVKAAESVQDFVQCTYKPSPSDALVTYCGTLKGEGYLSIRICGVNYTVDIICK